MGTEKIEAGKKVTKEYEDIFEVSPKGVYLDYYKIAEDPRKNPLKLGVFLDEKRMTYLIMDRDRLIIEKTIENPLLVFGDSSSHIASLACRGKKELDKMREVFANSLKEEIIKELKAINRDKEDLFLISLYTNTVFAHILAGHSPESLISFPYERNLKGSYMEDFSEYYREFGQGLFLINPQISRLIGSKFVMEIFELDLTKKDKTLLLNAGERGEIVYSLNGYIYSSEFSLTDIWDRIKTEEKEDALDQIGYLLEGYIKILVGKALGSFEIEKILVIEEKLPKLLREYLDKRMDRALRDKVQYIDRIIKNAIVKHMGSREEFSRLNNYGIDYLMIDTVREEKELVNNFNTKYYK